MFSLTIPLLKRLTVRLVSTIVNRHLFSLLSINSTLLFLDGEPEPVKEVEENEEEEEEEAKEEPSETSNSANVSDNVMVSKKAVTSY